MYCLSTTENVIQFSLINMSIILNALCMSLTAAKSLFSHLINCFVPMDSLNAPRLQQVFFIYSSKHICSCFPLFEATWINLCLNFFDERGMTSVAQS